MNSVELLMLPQSEDRQEINGQTSPGRAEATPRSHKHWLVAGIVLIVVAALLISGILSRIRARAGPRCLSLSQ